MIKSTLHFHLSLEKESNLTGIKRIGKALPPIGIAEERILHLFVM
jgi:hypothetical protein